MEGSRKQFSKAKYIWSHDFLNNRKNGYWKLTVGFLICVLNEVDRDQNMRECSKLRTYLKTIVHDGSAHP